MEFGLFYTFENPQEWGVPTSEVWREILSQIILAEELGYDSVWISEHHFDRNHFPSPSVRLGAIAAKTHKIKLGQSVALLPLHHPLEVAEDGAVLDVISDGRFELGVGIGYVGKEFDVFGVPWRQRGSRMDEELSILKGLWTNETFSYEGRYFKLDEVSLWPRPVQKPHPPIWVAALTPKAAERAGRHGCHLSGLRDPETFRVYEEALRRSGHDPKDFARATVRLTHVAETWEQAWENCAPHMLHVMAVHMPPLKEAGLYEDREGGSMGMRVLPPPSELPELAASGKAHFCETPLMAGTPEDMIKEVEEVRKAGITHMQLWMQLGGIDPRKTRSSIRLFAKEVMPLFRDSLARNS